MNETRWDQKFAETDDSMQILCRLFRSFMEVPSPDLRRWQETNALLRQSFFLLVSGYAMLVFHHDAGIDSKAKEI